MTLFLSWLPLDTREVINSDLASPQARAFDYMLQDPNYGTYTQARILQRYALVTLYFATQGDTWNQNAGWLSYDIHECDWQQSSTAASLALYDSTSVQVCSSIFTSDTSDRSYQSLQLANNNLQGTIPPELQLLTDLQVLDVSQNYDQLQGNLPDVMFERCTRLRDVVVFENQLTGSIPTALASLTNLQSFHAWDNQFVGPAFIFTTDDLFQKVTNLRQWHVGNNLLTGNFPSSNSSTASTSTTPSSLESLWVYGNQLSGSIPSDIAAWAGKLTSFLAWGNKLSGSLPTELGLLTLVEQLDLEENAFGGTIPSELGLLSTSLKSLWLSRNNLSGLIPSQLSQLPGLTILSLHTNKLMGRVLPSLGLLTSLYELTLQNNDFTGVIPTQLGNLMRTLRELKLGDNQLSGPIPTEIGRLFNLQRVQLQNNQLSGTVPSQFGALKTLQECALQNNQLNSALPTELGLLTQLTGLTVNQNAFTGRIPAELGSLSSKLKVLDLSSNQFSGLIPFALFPLVGDGSGHALEELTLAGNNLNGPIPTGVGSLGRLIKLDFGRNELTSFLPSEIGRLSGLSSLKLDSNQLMWTIPTEIGLLYSLEMLLLDFNNFAGAMPSEVGTMQQLKSLHLNDNPFLFGPIPERELASMTDLQELTLNGTGLTGTLPDEACFLAVLEVDCATTVANTKSGVCGCDCVC